MAVNRRLAAHRSGDVISVEEYRALVASEMSEEELLVAVQTELNLGRWRWHHVRRSDLAVTQGDPGWPDLVALRGPDLLAIELKRADGTHRPGQEAWLEAFAAVRHVRAGTWRPADLDVIRRILR